MDDAEEPGPDAVADPVLAGGGVLWRPGSHGPEVALIHRPRYDDWTVPKGKLDPGEDVLEAAVREVGEETGYQVEVGEPLGEIHYVHRRGDVPRMKVVGYWAMRALAGEFTPNREVDDLRWLPLEEALQAVTYSRDRDILQRFARRTG